MRSMKAVKAMKAAPAPKAAMKTSCMRGRSMKAVKAMKAAPAPKAVKAMKAAPKAMKIRVRKCRKEETKRRAKKYKEMKAAAEQALSLRQQLGALKFEVVGLQKQVDGLTADLGDQAQQHCVDLMAAKEVQDELKEEVRRLRQQLRTRPFFRR